MATVALEGTDGRTLTVGTVVSPCADADEPWSFDATLTIPLATASSAVWEYGRGGLAPFFRDLSVMWRGWDGVKKYSSLEGELKLECHHDGRGLVICAVSLGSENSPPWRLAAEISFGAGAHLERMAGELEAVFSAHEPR